MGNTQDRRSAVEIAADILRLLRLGDASKIEIDQVTHLSPAQASAYLGRLEEAGILERADDKMGLPAYRVTVKGLALLNTIESLREMMPPSGGVDLLHTSRIVGINIGEILASSRILDLSQTNKGFASFIQTSLDRYRRGDWNAETEREQYIMDQNRERNRSLFASYIVPEFPEIWIRTTGDRKYTEIVFPDEADTLVSLQTYASAHSRFI
jgi:predicted transcriptional regulator